MTVRRNFRWWIATVLAVIGIGLGANTASARPGGPGDLEQGVDVLTRGPVHEAFAETVTFDPEPGIVVTRSPREIIEEVPPDQRPEGINVTWIPGYWAWDDERDDFLWVSGIWRDLPPGRQWEPGYWAQSARGFQWISGYWEDAGANEVEYLPEPPETLESGPNIAAPRPNLGWIPGSWIWHQGRYAWRPGYWAAGRADWVWVPAHYVWTPRGYVYSDGYWDYSMERRGVLFAPVYFEKEVYARRDYSYSPSFVIDLTLLTDNLFVRPHYTHYYFGDYYAPSYHDSGYYASFSSDFSRHGYDPIYAHNRWEHRKDPAWGQRVEADYNHRRDHEDARPFRTLAAQIGFDASKQKSGEKRVSIATAFNQLVQRKNSPIRFQPVDKEERQQLARRGNEIQQSRGQRKALEAKAADPPADKSAKKREPVRVNLPKSPVVAKPVSQLGKGQAPPKRHQVPAPDLKIEPKPRKSVNNQEPAKQEPKAKQAEAKAEPAKPAPKDKPQVESKEKPKDAPKEKPQGESKDKPKDDEKKPKDAHGEKP